MGPHPAVAEVRRAVRAALGSCPEPVLVACSGGADSLALAAALAFEAPRVGRAAALITVDHGLRAGSAAQAARVAALGYELGFDPVSVVRVAVGTAGGPEAAARTARYSALSAAAASSGAVVLLGHTLDDQAETVLLGLGRGSGPRSIAGMRARTGCWVRPLLGVRRAVTRAACDALGLPVWDDPMNADPGLQRVRLRAEVLPLLESVLQGGVAESLARTAGLLQDDLDALDDLARDGDQRRLLAVYRPGLGVDHVEVRELVGLPRAIRTRVLRNWAIRLGATECTAERTAALEALVSDWHGQGPVELPGGVRVVRASDRLQAL